MNTFEELQEYVWEKRKLIKYSPTTMGDPLVRATEFLEVSSRLSDFKYKCEVTKTKVQTANDCRYSDAKNNSEGVNITEKKLDANVDSDYVTVREDLEELDAMIRWVRDAINMFNNAHITYRQVSRD